MSKGFLLRELHLISVIHRSKDMKQHERILKFHIILLKIDFMIVIVFSKIVFYYEWQIKQILK